MAHTLVTIAATRKGKARLKCTTCLTVGKADDHRRWASRACVNVDNFTNTAVDSFINRSFNDCRDFGFIGARGGLAAAGPYG